MKEVIFDVVAQLRVLRESSLVYSESGIDDGCWWWWWWYREITNNTRRHDTKEGLRIQPFVCSALPC